MAWAAISRSELGSGVMKGVTVYLAVRAIKEGNGIYEVLVHGTALNRANKPAGAIGKHTRQSETKGNVVRVVRILARLRHISFKTGWVRLPSLIAAV